MLPRVELPLRWMSEDVSTLFNRLFGKAPDEPEWAARWEMSVEEEEKEVVVRAELPGFEPEEGKVEVSGEQLMVEAEHKAPAEKSKEEAERTYAHVKRMISLPPGVDPEKAEAVYRNGVLEVRVPRKPEAMGHRIEVKT